MENETQEESRTENTFIVKDDKSTEEFQKFCYELFEKNGVLNDLRAYLRGHIINILKSVEEGDTFICQKHFTQRLEVTFQAINMLIAEYLMRMDFSYSLSVFISEIPLANMIFDFAKSLLGCKPNMPQQDMRFKDRDVWCVLNYIGVKCDSESAANIVNMYRNEERPLLLCILKCITLHKNQLEDLGDNNLKVSASNSSCLSEEASMNTTAGSETCTCKHLAFCSTCKQKIKGFQMQYKKKKRKLRKSLDSSDRNVNVQKFLREVDVTERSIIDQMFEQLKAVYEAEVDMVREEEERKIKRSLANHALLLQRRYDEMEESFKAREAELECSVRQRKKFLWGLARALREQHSNMADAMRAVQKESERLTAKEDSLKVQISEAEQMLRKKGEDMRDQISSELIILEGQLSSMRRERDEIEKERSELETLKKLCISTTKVAMDNARERELFLADHEELLALRKCMRVEKAVMTDGTGSSPMNNRQELERSARSEDLRTPNQLVNDLKKRKNVNFDQDNLEEIIPDRSRDCHLELLRQENERLKAFADQQHRHIEELTRDRSLLRSQLGVVLARPRTAPPAIPSVLGVNPSGSGFDSGWRKGGGEELSVFAPTRPLLPGDRLPFVGLLPDRRSDNGRHLIKQWRTLRRRLATDEDASPQAGTSRQDDAEPTRIAWPVSPQLVVPVNETFGRAQCNQEGGAQKQPDTAAELNKIRVKSPKSVLREAKQKLRHKDSVKRQPVAVSREKSPNTTLREAKLRLRKLEIEAEAAERSYRDFRRRSQMSIGLLGAQDSIQTLGDEWGLDIHRSSSSQKDCKYENKTSEHDLYSKVTKDLLTKDFDKYLKDYQPKQITRQSQFIEETFRRVRTKPTPNAYLNETRDLEEARRDVNYLETPITEFRKLYHNEKSRLSNTESVKMESSSSNVRKTEADQFETIQPRTDTKTDVKHIDNADENMIVNEEPERSSSKELKILKDHVSEMGDAPSDPILFTQESQEASTESIRKSTDDRRNLLSVQVENVTETNSVQISERNALTIVVESSINTNALKVTQNNPVTVLISPRANSATSPRDVNADVIHSVAARTHQLSPGRSARCRYIAKSDGITTSVPSPKAPRENETKSADISEACNAPEKAANLTRYDVLDAIFDAAAAEAESNVEIGLENSKGDGDSLKGLENSKGDGDSPNGTESDLKDYPDDFSADVDNYNSNSDLGNSPISFPKASEEDNFWD